MPPQPHLAIVGTIQQAISTLLTTYEARLDKETFERFVARYREVLGQRFEDARPFLCPFPRILLWGSRRA